MKKITFLVASVLMTCGIVNATENRTNFNFEEPITFMERGIEFFVFPNGEFDFNTRPEDSQGSYYYKTAGRREITVSTDRTLNYGTLIEHDSFGRVRRIGNTFINYDNQDRVNRIGTVYMRYNRFALMQIGGMQIVYNRRGEIIDTIGSIKGFRNQGYAYSNNYYNNNYHDNYTSNYQNDDTYYYKQDGNSTRKEEVKKEK